MAQDQPETRTLLEAGRREFEFENGDLQRSLEHFERSYRLSHRPEILFNIGTVLDRLRHDAQALAAYRGYLLELPDASSRRFVRSRARTRSDGAQRLMFGELRAGTRARARPCSVPVGRF